MGRLRSFCRLSTMRPPTSFLCSRHDSGGAGRRHGRLSLRRRGRVLRRLVRPRGPPVNVGNFLYWQVAFELQRRGCRYLDLGGFVLSDNAITPSGSRPVCAARSTSFSTSGWRSDATRWAQAACSHGPGRTPMPRLDRLRGCYVHAPAWVQSTGGRLGGEAAPQTALQQDVPSVPKRHRAQRVGRRVRRTAAARRPRKAVLVRPRHAPLRRDAGPDRCPLPDDRRLVAPARPGQATGATRPGRPAGKAARRDGRGDHGRHLLDDPSDLLPRQRQKCEGMGLHHAPVAALRLRARRPPGGPRLPQRHAPLEAGDETLGLGSRHRGAAAVAFPHDPAPSRWTTISR